MSGRGKPPDDLPITSSYASAVSKGNTNVSKRKHNRPRSLFMKTFEGSTFDEIWNIFQENDTLKSFENKIEALYPSGLNVWILTFKPKKRDEELATREIFMSLLKHGVNVPGRGNISFELPYPPAKHIIIQGIPAETTVETAINDINRYGFGKARNIIRIYRRNTSIYNGRCNAWIMDFEQNKMPVVIQVDGYYCHVFLPEDLYEKKCNRCLSKDHATAVCKGNIVCRNCKKEGHIQKDCPKIKTIPRLRKFAVSNPENSSRIEDTVRISQGDNLTRKEEDQETLVKPIKSTRKEGIKFKNLPTKGTPLKINLKKSIDPMNHQYFVNELFTEKESESEVDGSESSSTEDENENYDESKRQLKRQRDTSNGKEQKISKKEEISSCIDDDSDHIN